MSNLIPVSDIEKMANVVAKSGLFGMKTPEQAMALMLIAQADGCHPAAAAKEYHIIQGRPALKADAMLARFQQAGGRVKWMAYSDSEVSGEFSHPAGGSVTISWTIEQAKRAGLTNKDVWKQYPRQMLRSRVISEGIRTVFPGVAVGVYTVEEVEDFDSKPLTKELKNVEVTPFVPPVQPKPAAVAASAEIVTSEEAAPVEAPAEDEATERKRLFSVIAKSPWTKQQKADHAKARGYPDPKTMPLNHLRNMAEIVTNMTYDEYMAPQV